MMFSFVINRWSMEKLFVFLFVGLLCGCSIYQVPIVQGNYLRKDMIDKVKLGQTKEEVLGILGEPVLLSLDSSDSKLIYLYKEKDNSKVEKERNYQMIIKFKQNKVYDIYVKS